MNIEVFERRLVELNAAIEDNKNQHNALLGRKAELEEIIKALKQAAYEQMRR